MARAVAFLFVILTGLVAGMFAPADAAAPDLNYDSASTDYDAAQELLVIDPLGLSFAQPSGDSPSTSELGFAGTIGGKNRPALGPAVDFVAPSTGGQRIALGLGDDLDDFAGAQGAITYRDFPGGTGRFADDFYEFAGNPSNDVLFNLDGVRNPWSSVQRAGDLTLDEAMRAGASITDWELAQVYRNNWTHVQFFENGVLAPSPFG